MSHADETDTVEPPPFLRTWRRLYVAVICYLVVLLVLLYVVTHMFRY